MAGIAETSGKYSVFVTGGNANVGHRAKMNIYGRQKRRYSTNISTRATSNITGPGQVLKEIPSSVLSEVVLCLNRPSPLSNNWKAVAAEMLLSYQVVQSLDHHSPGGMMDGLLEMMFHIKMTVGDFVQLLKKIERPDAIEIFIKAGFPENTVRKNETDVEDDICSGSIFQAVTIATPDISTQTTSNACANKHNGNDIEHRSNNKSSEYAQPTIDLPISKNVSGKENKVFNEYKFTNVSDNPSGCGVICEEVVKARGTNLAKESSEEMVLGENNTESTIIDGIARFVSTSYSGLCGKLSFRAN